MTGRGLQATPPFGPRTSGASSASHWSPPIFPPRGGGGASSPGVRAAWGTQPLWVLLGGGGGKIPLSSASGAIMLRSTFTFCDRGRATLDVGPTGAAFISHPWFCTARGNCKMEQYCNAASCWAGWQRVLGTGVCGAGRVGTRSLSCGWQFGPGCTWRRGGGGGAGEGGRASLEDHWPVSPPLSPPRLSKQDLSTGACRAGLECLRTRRWLC